MFVGTAIHRALEQWDFDHPTEQQIELAGRRIVERLAAWLDRAQATAAITHAGELWRRFTGGTLGRRWLEIGPSIVGRELPLIMPAPPEHAAIDCLTGAIDLVYRDPDDGAWVVVDFKTDRVEDGEALAARAAVYEPQEAVYVGAVRQACELSTPPRAELWFLWADTVWRSS